VDFVFFVVQKAYETATCPHPLLSKCFVIPTAKQEESRERKWKTCKKTNLYLTQYQLFKKYVMRNFNAFAL